MSVSRSFRFAVLGAFVAALLPVVAHGTYGDVTTFRSRVYLDSSSTSEAYFDFPQGMVGDGDGSFYIADTYNNVIRKYDSQNDRLSTVAGTGGYGQVNGATGATEFAWPYDVAIDSSGDIYVADTYNDAIRKISGGSVTTIVQGLDNPEGVYVVNNTLYIADTGSGTIKTASLSGQSLSTLASGLSRPTKMSHSGNRLFVAETGRNRILSINRSSGARSTLAGGAGDSSDGTGSQAGFKNPYGLSVSGNTLYVAEDTTVALEKLRAVNIDTQEVTTVFIETLGKTLRRVRDVEVYSGSLYALSKESRINRFSISDPSGDNELVVNSDFFNDRVGLQSDTMFGRPYDMAFTSDRQTMYLAVNNKIRKINMVTKSSSHVIGRSVDNYIEGTDADDVAFSTITGIAVSNDNETLYVVDHWNNRIRKITNLDSTPVASLVSGTGEINCSESCNGYREGSRTTALFDNPTSIVLSVDGSTAYVTDTGNNRIRSVNLSTGATSLVAGSGEAGYADGVGSVAEFNKPVGLAISNDGTTLYVTDQNNDRIRKIVIATQSVTTLAGSGTRGYRDGLGTLAVLSLPAHIETGADGNLYLTEAGSNRVRFIDPDTASVRTIAGSGTQGFLNGAAASAKFNDPKGMLVDTQGSVLYVADYFNDLIRGISIPGEAPFFDAAPSVTSVSPRDRYNVGGSPTDTKFLSINGSGFAHGAVSSFGGLTSTSTSVVSSSRVDVQIPFGKLPPGYHDVKVTNVDGQSSTLEGGFIVLNADGSLPPEDTAPRDATRTFFGYDNLRGNFTVAAGNMVGGIADEIVQGTGPGLSPQVRLFDQYGDNKGNFFAFAETLKSGVRLAPCDLNGDARDELIVSAGPPGRPHIRVLDSTGNITVSSGFFALDQKFQGGTNVACGEINGTGNKELLVAASRGGGPQVTIHEPSGNIIANFFAYGEAFRGGVNIATADMNGDGKDEIITAPENGAPQIQTFRVVPGQVERINPGFYAFHPDFRGGLSIAGGDINGDGELEYAAAQRTNGQAWVKIYNRRDELLDTFLAYRGSYQGGANIAMGDVDGDGKDEVITIPTAEGLPEIKVFD
ncbi:MAG: VCBS repeat-containing protein, partial [Candidatus Andersenbacteria bacterium]|nr:VCBS repeat-containing protein [Candidatus Andersenbacteria bacterium]